MLSREDSLLAAHALELGFGVATLNPAHFKPAGVRGAEFQKGGRGVLFQQLQPFHQGDASGPAYAEVARRLGTTEGTIKVTVHRLCQRYRERLRAVVSQTVSNPIEVDAEIAHLMAALRR